MAPLLRVEVIPMTMRDAGEIEHAVNPFGRCRTDCRLFNSARNCSAIRRKLERGRPDHPCGNIQFGLAISSGTTRGWILPHGANPDRMKFSERPFRKLYPDIVVVQPGLRQNGGPRATDRRGA